MSVLSSTKSKLNVLGRSCIKCSNVLAKSDSLGNVIYRDLLYKQCVQNRRWKGTKSALSKNAIVTNCADIHSASQTHGSVTQHHDIVATNIVLSENWKPVFSTSKLNSTAFLQKNPSLPQTYFVRCQQIHSSPSLDIFKTFSANENKASQPEAKLEDTKETGSTSEDSSALSGDVAKLQEDIERLTTENGELKTKNDETLDKYRRSIAENDNMRKRLTKQIEDAKIFGIQGFCKDLLEVADVLQKAVEAARAEDKKLGGSLSGGIELTQTQMHQVFNRHGLTKITPEVGETKFDPNMHEALFQIPVPDKDPNIVMDVQQIGYSLHGRTIRPAKVGVSKK